MKRLQHLPFVHIENNQVSSKLEKKPVSKIIVDILDGDLWSSKVSFWGNLILITLIVISVIEVVLSSDIHYKNDSVFLLFCYYLTNIFFTIEISCRIFYSKYTHTPFTPYHSLVRYFFSFYGLVDILSILPFLFHLFNYDFLSILLIIRIFRIWRIARFINAFSSISDAFRSKRDEMLVSFLGVILLSLTLSSFIFYAESSKGSDDFNSILSVFVWSLGKYTGDYGAIAGASPITGIGKFLATINGLLGLALFAIPAGLLGSAFIDSLTERKRKIEVNQRIALINNHFEQSTGGKKSFIGKKAFARFFVFDTIQTRFLLSDQEILESIRASDNLRFRAMKSQPSVRYNDTKLVERFMNNSSYGCKTKGSRNIYIINPSGASERCISHFTYSLAHNLDYSYISRERRLYSGEEEIGANYSIFYKEYNMGNTAAFPEAFTDFMTDVSTPSKEDVVLVIQSCASGRADFILEYGNVKGNEAVIPETSTISSKKIVEEFQDNFTRLAKNVSIESSRATVEEFSFSFENHSIGNFDQKWIGKTIHRLTGANVLTLYVNINILIGEDDRYYAGLNLLYQTLECTFGESE